MFLSNLLCDIFSFFYLYLCLALFNFGSYRYFAHLSFYFLVTLIGKLIRAFDHIFIEKGSYKFLIIIIINYYYKCVR